MISLRSVFLVGAIFIIVKGLLVGVGVDLPDRLGYKIDNQQYYALKSIVFGIILFLVGIKFFPKRSKK